MSANNRETEAFLFGQGVAERPAALAKTSKTKPKPTAGFPLLADSHELQVKIERFITAYVEHLSPARAYKDAFLVENTTNARDQAHKLLKNAVVRAEVDRRVNNKQVLADVTRERINIELARMAFADTRKLFKVVEVEEGGRTVEKSVLREAHEIDDDTAAALSGIQVSASGRVSVKTVDKRAALMDLAKLNGLLVDKKQVRVTVTTDDVDPDELDQLDEGVVLDGELVEDDVE